MRKTAQNGCEINCPAFEYGRARLSLQGSLQKDRTEELNKQLQQTKEQLASSQAKLSAMASQLIAARAVVNSLLEQKIGMVNKLRLYQPSQAGYNTLISQLRGDLDRIDIGIQKALLAQDEAK